MIPIPQQDLMEQAANFALYFSRMTPWIEQREKLEPQKDAVISLGNKAEKIMPRCGAVLEQRHTQQNRVLEDQALKGAMVWEFLGRLRTPYVSGLGAVHPTETGMILDRNSGLPYIPASSIKGVLRLAHALELSEQVEGLVRPTKDGYEIPDDTPAMRRYFGDVDPSKKDGVRGQLVFLDAFPADVPRLRADIMNPHFHEYYAKKSAPLETEPPIPVKFLTVAQTTAFTFRCFALPLGDEPPAENVGELRRPFDNDDDRAVRQMFSRALTELGLGAKTSIGYGRFEVAASADTGEIRRRAQERKKKEAAEAEAERIRQENEKYPWRPVLRELDGTADWQTLRKKIETDQILREHRNESEVGEAIAAIAQKLAAHLGVWSAGQDRLVAGWLKPSGVTWIPRTATSEEQPDNETLAKIKGFSSRANYDRSLVLSELDIDCCRALKPLFKDWKWNTKKAKKGNQELWKELQARVKKLTESNG
jgi:CRISPR-associated protein Cmr6